jgi:hypothetical protein
MTRRAILVVVGVAVTSLLLLVPAFWAIEELNGLRRERSRLEQAASQPRADAALVVPGLAVPGGNLAAARWAMAVRVRELSRSGGVLVEELRAAPGGPGLATVRLRVSGPEKAVIALADTIEREAPLMRLVRWRIEAIDTGVRLEGELVGAWR